MALNFNGILIGSAQPDVLADFYGKVLGRKPDFADGGYTGWQFGSTGLVVGPHSEVGSQAKEPQRVLFGFSTHEVKEEFARVKGIGATVVKEPYEMGSGWIATLADPDGNYFQLTTPYDMAGMGGMGGGSDSGD